MSDPTTASFSASVTSTSVSESTPGGGAVTAASVTSADSAHPTPVTSTFTSSTPGVGFSFGTALPSTSSTLSFGSAGSSTFGSSSSLSSPTTSSTAAAGGEDSASTDDPEVAPEEESTARFTPVVRLTEVQTSTGEEDDDVLYTQRSALYRFDSAVSEWKERGKGDVKLLKSKTTGKVRVLMRQEKTLKLCANHIVLPSLDLKPNAGSDRSWTWRCKDYAGDAPEDQTFAIRFKDSDIAGAFKSKWDEVKEINAKILGEKEKA